MPVIPQANGALLVKAPGEQTAYDMGNHRLFTTCNGRGNITRALLAEGHDLGRWKLHLALDGQPLSFSQGRAIGRTWELRGVLWGVDVVLTTYLDETSPAIFQQCLLRNASPKARQLEVGVDLDFRPDARWSRRLRAQVAGRLPRLLGQEHLWSQGWAKPLLPSSPRRVEARPGGRVVALGAVPLCWGATHPPQAVRCRGRKAQIQYLVDVPPFELVETSWVLGVADFEAHPALVERRVEALTEARIYARWLSSHLEGGDPLLQSLFVAGLNAAVAMFKEFPGDFAGLVAGPDYAYPPRLYFRDAYWTAQVLLPTRPDLVRRHLLSLASGVHADGECPSAVFAPHLADAWGVRGPGRLDWLPDHYDAPPYLVLLLADYLRVTGDWDVVEEPLPQVPGGDGAPYPRTLWRAAEAAARYLISRDRDGDGLIEKPNDANDWADNVRRGTWVTYDQALYAAALQAAAGIAGHLGEYETESHFRDTADAARRALDEHLWDPVREYYVNYKRPGFVEDHFSIDTLVTAYYGLADRSRTRALLAAAHQLQTRHNSDQPYGDWGVLSVFPPYRRSRDLFGKSAQPYRYHNGADWPYWDGVYGALLKRMGDPDWSYVLTRWWEYSLQQGWLTPVEYYAPAFPPGGLLQGWSAMPAAALLDRP